MHTSHKKTHGKRQYTMQWAYEALHLWVCILSYVSEFQYLGLRSHFYCSDCIRMYTVYTTSTTVHNIEHVLQPYPGLSPVPFQQSYGYKIFKKHKQTLIRTVSVIRHLVYVFVNKLATMYKPSWLHMEPVLHQRIPVRPTYNYTCDIIQVLIYM